MKKQIQNKKRILVLNYEFPPLGGGASPVSYEISKGYAKLGHKVTVVTMHMKGLKQYERKEGMDIYRVKCIRSKKEICHPWEQYSYLVSAKRFLKQHLKDNKYDICHCHFIIPTGVLALWVKKTFGIPYIVTSHGSDVLGYNKRFRYLYPLLARKWKEIIKEAKVVTTPSQFLQNKIKEITNKGKFIVIPNGIDPKKFKPMKKENKILVVARLFPNKGVQDILDALKGVDLKGWKVDIVGDGPYRSFLENKAKQNGLQSVVKFHGWIDNNSKKMKELYGKAKIFISASYFENMSMVLLEALASGCHVIASNVGGNPEVVKKEDLFEAKDTKGIKSKILLTVSKIEKPVPLNKSFNLNNITINYTEKLE